MYKLKSPQKRKYYQCRSLFIRLFSVKHANNNIGMKNTSKYSKSIVDADINPKATIHSTDK